MTWKRGVAAALGLVLVATVAVVWVIPTVQGPTVECIEIDPVACDQAWRSEAAAIGGIQQILPVTKARVGGSPEVTCVQVYLEWLGGVFAVAHEEFC
jgi:hypothetical protein